MVGGKERRRAQALEEQRARLLLSIHRPCPEPCCRARGFCPPVATWPAAASAHPFHPVWGRRTEVGCSVRSHDIVCPTRRLSHHSITSSHAKQREKCFKATNPYSERNMAHGHILMWRSKRTCHKPDRPSVPLSPKNPLLYSCVCCTGNSNTTSLPVRRR